MKIGKNKPLALKLATYLLVFATVIVPNSGGCLLGLIGEPELPTKMRTK